MTIRRATGRRRSFRRGPRQRTFWENLAFLHTHTALASIVISDLTPEPNQTLHGYLNRNVLQRAIIHVDARLTVTGAVMDNRISYGIIVANEDNVTELPNPDVDFNTEWYWWAFRSKSAFNSTSVDPMYPVIDVDIRSKRVIEPGKKLMLVSSTPVNDVTSDALISMRLLWTRD